MDFLKRIFGKKVFLSDAQKKQFLATNLVDFAYFKDKKISIASLESNCDWPNMRIVIEGELCGYLERVKFAPPFIVVQHIATAKGKTKSGYGKAMATGLARLARSLKVERIIFSEEMQGAGHPIFFQKMGAKAWTPVGNNQLSPDFAWKIVNKDEISRNPSIGNLPVATQDAILSMDKLVMSLIRNSHSSSTVEKAIDDLQKQHDALFPLYSQEAHDEVRRIDLALVALKKFR